MLLKRLYHQDKLVRNVRGMDQALKDPGRPEDVVLEVLPGAVRGVQVLRAGARQHFSPGIIEGGVAEGWLSMGKGKLVIQGEDGAIVYRIARTPGHYCCHCQKAVDDGSGGQAHVAAAHAGKVSPDPSNPAGYRRDNFYACVREE